MFDKVLNAPCLAYYDTVLCIFFLLTIFRESKNSLKWLWNSLVSEVLEVVTGRGSSEKLFLKISQNT